MMRRSALQIARQLLRATEQAAVQPAAAALSSAAAVTASRSAASLGAWFVASRAAQGVAGGARAAPAYHTARGARFMTFPPRPGGRWGWNPLLPELDPSRVVWGLIVANGAAFLLWRSHPHVMSRHFVVSLDALRDGRFWTTVTSAFSQQDTGHLAANMISLYFFGTGVGQMFGGRKLLLLYLGGALAGSLAHCGWTYYQEHKSGVARRPAWMRGPSRGALGASAAINAIVITDVLLFPTRTVLLYGFIPLPAALLGALYIWNDVGGVLTPHASPVAHAGHLGGAAAGLAFFLAYKRGLIRAQRLW